MKLRICVAQVRYRKGPRHIDRIKDIISRNRSADLIVFPELILHGHPSERKPEGLLYRRMKVLYEFRRESTDLYDFVRSVGARIIIGELTRRGDRYVNLATYVDSRTKESYVKTHVHWTENFAPGKELKVFATPMGKVGINICFDGAFSEVWRVLALRGADLIVNISAVPRSFPVDYMWRRCRGAALNNQLHVVYANRAGRSFSGHSAVFSPTGEILAAAGKGECVFTVDIEDLDRPRWRKKEPIFPNRRPRLYREIVRM